VNKLKILFLTSTQRFDDIEDGSDLRRGHPAAHSVFGIPQTINAASFAIVDAVSKANEIPIPGVIDITLGKEFTPSRHMNITPLTMFT
jgi:geranylgeranyl pyrophosphate synthase